MAIQKKKTSAGSAKKAQLLPGVTDIVPGVDLLWDLMFRRLQKYSRSYGFARIDTPIVESGALYENDPRKNPVTFMAGDGDRVALRSDSISGVMRAYIEKKVSETQRISKWYHLQQTVNYDQKQKNFVSSWQYGFEIFGEFPALLEVQMMTAIWKFLRSMGLEELTLEINCIGKSSERADYEDALKSFLQNKNIEFCSECVANIEDNPLEVFRCNNRSCQSIVVDAPQAIDYLTPESHKHFTHVLEALDEIGLPYILNPLFVGGATDSGTVFVFKYRHNDKDYVIGQGGGHTDLMKTVTGKEVNCFGYISNFEVLHEILSQLQTEIITEVRAEVFLAPLGDMAARKALRLFAELWDANIYAHDSFGDGGVKNQLKLAEGSKAIIALIIGQKEAMDDTVILRDVKSGMQEVFQYERIIEEVKKRLGR